MVFILSFTVYTTSHFHKIYTYSLLRIYCVQIQGPALEMENEPEPLPTLKEAEWRRQCIYLLIW